MAQSPLSGWSGWKNQSRVTRSASCPVTGPQPRISQEADSDYVVQCPLSVIGRRARKDGMLPSQQPMDGLLRFLEGDMLHELRTLNFETDRARCYGAGKA